MNPAAPVRRIDIRLLFCGQNSPMRRAAGCSCRNPPILPRQVFSDCPDPSAKGALQAAAVILQSKRQARLLDDLPQHRLATGREAFLQPIVPCHEIIDRVRPTGKPRGSPAHALPRRAGLRRSSYGEPALVGIDASA